jgi:hypothetical protein
MIALIAAALAASPTAVLDDPNGWTSIGTRASALGPIEVRSRAVGSVTCYEGVAHAEADPDALLAVTRRMARANEWSSSRLTVSRELARDGESFVLFQVLDVPGWTLASDRYWVLRGTNTWLPGGAGEYRYERVDAAAWPEVAATLSGLGLNAIELPMNFGKWRFDPEGSGARVTYRGCASFGGALSSGIQSWLALQQLPTMMEELVGAAR